MFTTILIDSKNYLEQQKQKKVESLNVPNVKELINIVIQNEVYQYKGVDLCIAKNCLNLVTGYSGVGKSSLLREYFPQKFEKYEYINQKHLQGNKNSYVATALDISGNISEIFAKKFSKDKKCFSNLTGNDGMCPICHGAGFIEYRSDGNLIARLECGECEGTGFNKILKKYKIDGKTIFDVWKMTIIEGIDYFAKIDKKITESLEKAAEIMLGHLKIGQPTGTLSGGENIRIKVLKSRKVTTEVLGVNEPFKGLNPQEIFRMVKYFYTLCKEGRTIVIVDHTENVDNFFSKKIYLKNDDGILRGMNCF